MTSFSEANFAKKLSDLNNTQQSIQTLSLWLIHHRKHAKSIVNVWNQELRKAQGNKKLTFMYLANDVIQNSKKKGSEFTVAFESSLPKAFAHAHRDANDKIRGSLQRLLAIWRERNVYNKATLRHIKHALSHMSKSPRHAVAEVVATPEPRPVTPPITNSFNKKKLADKVLHTLSDEIASVPPQEQPDLDLLASAINDLENSASSDAAIREKIAALPPEVSDISYLDKISDKLEAESFDAMVEDACSLLTGYNSRLAQELTDRKKVAMMLRDFIAAQKLQLEKDEQLLKDYATKQTKANVIRAEIKSHIQNLPDLSRLPELTRGLGPLPSAGDLFNI